MPDRTNILAGRKIAIIEDIPLHVVLLRKFLEGHGAYVSSFSDWEEACPMLVDVSNNFDFLLLDLSLPVTDGLDILMDIHEGLVMNFRRVIVISARCEKETVKKAMDLGADGFIPKPVDLRRLIALMEDLTEANGTVPDVR